MSNYALALSREQIQFALSQLTDVSLLELRARQEEARERLLRSLAEVNGNDVRRITQDGTWLQVETQVQRYIGLCLAVDRKDPRQTLARWASPWPEVQVDRAVNHTAEAGLELARYLLWLGKISTGTMLGIIEPRMELLRGEDCRYQGIVVDWGCGGDLLKGWLAKHGQMFDGQVFGIDQSPEALTVARQKVDALVQTGIIRAEQVQFVEANVADLHLLPSEVLDAKLHVSTLLLHEVAIDQQILLLLANRSAQHGYRHSLHADTPWSLGLAVTYLGTWFACRKHAVPSDIAQHFLNVQKRTMRETVPLRFLNTVWGLVGAKARRLKGIFVVCEPQENFELRESAEEAQIE
ncbi:MAG: class I SAM-dependent methyltransferase, partial [Candidatus Cloacimonetes bacterium]|nr:class I SAM-dependent methyltransferase [Candidatus Cloacimonadota bacterium]